MGSVGHRHRDGSLNADGRRIALARSSEDKNTVGGDVSSFVGESGSIPLKDGRKERYCQKVVSGVEPLEAWWQSFCDDEGKERYKRATALSWRSRCGNSPDVMERVDWLRKTVGRCSSITKEEKQEMLDTLLKTTYERAMSDDASAKEVSAFLDTLARHDLVNGDVIKPKLEIVFPQLDSILGGAAIKAVERRLGIGVKRLPDGGGGEVLDV